MKYTAQTYSPETESAKTVRLIFASVVMLFVLLAFSEKITMLTAVLIWLTLGCAAAAVSSLIANLIRHVSRRLSREAIICMICGLGGASIAAASLNRIAEAGCSCEYAAGHSAKFLFYLVPPLAAVALVYLIICIVRQVLERRSKAASELDANASA